VSANADLKAVQTVATVDGVNIFLVRIRLRLLVLANVVTAAIRIAELT
jgi:hypothetical protein